MRMALGMAALLLAASAATARLVPVWSYQQLYTNADLVAVLSVESVSVSSAVSTNNPYPGQYSNYVARCRVQWVFKGDPALRAVDVPFFQHPTGMPGFNGAMPAPFTGNPTIDYLVFLKRDKQGGWVPVAGSYDAALSIRQLRSHTDARDLKLPLKGMLKVR